MALFYSKLRPLTGRLTTTGNWTNMICNPTLIPVMNKDIEAKKSS